MNENPQTNLLPETGFAFHGSHTRAVDTKGRFNLPFKFLRGGSGPEEDRFVVSKGADGELTLSPHCVWEANHNRLREAAPSSEMRDYLRRKSAKALIVEPDSQGRVAVKKEMLSKFGIDKKISIVGMGNYMELWAPAALEALDVELETDAAFDNIFFG